MILLMTGIAAGLRQESLTYASLILLMRFA